MSDPIEHLRNRLTEVHQQHLIQFWEQLDADGRDRLVGQLESLDLALIESLVRGHDESPDWAELASRAQPPRAIRRFAEDNEFTPEQARSRGEAALRAGRLGMILVAGGQGTRLGFAHPKGMLPVGPISNRTLFEILIDRLRAIAQRYGVRIPLFLMTSPATHDETVAFLDESQRFGLAEDDLRVFCQGVMPAVDLQTGKLLLQSHDSLFLSPDGHGGMLAALDRSGCLQEARNRGLRHLFYGQVDNPLLQICDECLIGYHVLADSEMTTQVVRKQDPLDRVGNVAIIDGQMQIIEYSDLPNAAANQRNEDGSLRLWAGSIAVHVFEVSFLERMAKKADSLPFHRARKKAPYLTPDGTRVTPQAPNAVKFERFIFDLLPAARNSIVVEAAPEDAFAPVKNASGATEDTVETAQSAMIRRDRALLNAAGISVANDVGVEVNPRFALQVEDVRQRLPASGQITEPTYFQP
jgi:UDP-N-acetylglucosamine/UDP-N-acetylgalactosamine diphosphorylase